MAPRFNQAVTAAFLLAAIVGAAPAHSKDFSQCSPETPEECLNGVSASVTAVDALRATAETSLQEEITLFEDDLWSVWTSAGYMDFDSEFAVAPYDADQKNFAVGIDTMVNDRMTAGLMLGYEDLSTHTFFNGGGNDSDGWTLGTYLTYAVTDRLSLDANLAYGSLDNSQHRIDPQSGGTLTSDFDSTRWGAAANLTHWYELEQWSVSTFLGLLYARETQDGYTETGGPSARTVGERKVELTQGIIGAEAAYAQSAMEPYARLAYRYDFDREDGRGAGGLPSDTGATQPDDDDEWEAAIGVRYFSAEQVSLSAEVLKVFGREDYDNLSVYAMARFEF